MHCSACGGEVAEGAKFCSACGAALTQGCPRCGTTPPAGAKFCAECGATLAFASFPPPPPSPVQTPKHLAEKILRSRDALAGERKQVTVLFADVRGSMDLQEAVDAEDWRGIMNGLFQALADGVHRYEGTVNQFTGDGLMALFGAPIAHEDHAQRACCAALQVRDDVQRYAARVRDERGVDVAVRLGLNSGEVVVGGIGDDLHMDYTAIGHTVGLAQRMEAAAAPGTAYVSERTAHLVEGFFDLVDLGARAIKGVQEPLHVFELRGVGSARTHLDVARARGLSKFVGRDAEMRMLHDALDRARHGQGCVVGVVALAGTGKSRLCYEFAEQCRAKGVPVYAGYGLAHGMESTHLPMAELLRNWVGIADHDAAEAARTKIDRKLASFLPDVSDEAQILGAFLGVADATQPPLQVKPDALQRRVVGLVQRAMQRTGEPCVFLLEDLHWFDDASRGMLAQLVESFETLPVLTLVSFRPECDAPWMRRSLYQQMALAPLDAEATDQLLADLLGADPSLSGVPGLIRAHTGGNPFFIEEAVTHLAERGSLVGDRGTYRLTEPIADLSIPPTVQAVLDARIDRLPERQKHILQTAAVIGRTFGTSILHRVLGNGAADADAALTALVGGEFVHPTAREPEPEYMFKHALTQEVAYHSLLTERRRQTHAAVAQALEAEYPETLDERAAIVAHHYEQAGDALTAAFWHRRAAEWNGKRDFSAAYHHWRRVRELLGGLPQTDGTRAFRLEACIRLLTGGWVAGQGPDEVAALFEDGSSLTEDPTVLALLRGCYGFAQIQATGDVRSYLEIVREGARLGKQSGDVEIHVVTLAGLVGNLWMRGAVDEVLARTEEGIGLTEANPELGTEFVGICPLVWFSNLHGLALLWLGRPREAASALERAAELATERGDLEMLGWSHVYGAEISRFLGDPPAALAHARKMVAIADKIGSPADLVLTHGALAEAQMAAGDFSSARSLLEDALARSERTSTGRVWQTGWITNLAEAYLGTGDGARALATAERAVAACVECGVGSGEVEARLVLARVLLHTEGLAARARIANELHRALALVEETGARIKEPFIRMELAELARLTGDVDERDRELREAHRLFTEMGAPIRARQVEESLRATAPEHTR